MTLRAVLLGLLGAAFIAGVGYLNDFHVKLTYLVGNFLPIFVFGGLVLFLLLVNPGLRLLRLGLSSKELATVLMLMLVVGSIPSSGLLRTFTITLAMPANLASKNTDWGPKRNNLLAYVPDHMLASKVDDTRVVGHMMQGMGKSNDKINIKDVPWAMEPVPNASGQVAGWERPLAFWVPLILLVFMGLLGMSLVVHRQWSANELLRYPIVEFAAGVMEQEEGKLFAKIFYNRLFWIGLAVPLFIHLVNGRYAWNTSGLQILMNVDMSAPFRELWPDLEKSGLAWGIMNPKLYITVAAFSYLLSNEVGLSLGLSNYLFAFLAAGMYAYNVDISTDYWTGGIFPYQVFGSWLGAALIILYAGRNYYMGVLRRALGLASRTEVAGYSVWGARVFLVCMSGAVAWLTVGGMDLFLAILVMLMITLMLLVIGRINAETGLFFIQPGWPIVGCVLGMFGMEAIGPKMLILLGLVVTVLAADPRESLMPFILNGLKLSEKVNLRPGRTAPWMAVALLVGLGVGLPVVMWTQYNFGVTSHGDQWMTEQVPSFTFKTTSQQMDKLRNAGTLDSAIKSTGSDQWSGGFSSWDRAKQSTWISRIGDIHPDRKFLLSAGLGLGIVLLLNWARLRWNWWPIHPILFMVWASVPMAHFAQSFMCGWVARSLVVRLGGGKSYQKVKPLMYGLIAGDLLGGLLFMGIGAGYYLLNGVKPKLYQIFPF